MWLMKNNGEKGKDYYPHTHKEQEDMNEVEKNGGSKLTDFYFCCLVENIVHLNSYVKKWT